MPREDLLAAIPGLTPGYLGADPIERIRTSGSAGPPARGSGSMAEPTETDAWRRGVEKARAAMAQGEADRRALGDEGTVSVSVAARYGTVNALGQKIDRVSFKLCAACGWGLETAQHREACGGG